VYKNICKKIHRILTSKVTQLKKYGFCVTINGLNKHPQSSKVN